MAPTFQPSSNITKFFEVLKPQMTKNRILKKNNRQSKPPTAEKPTSKLADAILPMRDPYMTQIVDGSKTYEFRRYQLSPSVRRIWFYRIAPHSQLEFACEIDPGVTRGHEGDKPLPEDGLGNREFNECHKDWDGYDWAYHIKSVWRLKKPLTLKELGDKYGFKSAPRGLVYLPKELKRDVAWDQQEKIR
jgi:predicted transcriptional regulator